MQKFPHQLFLNSGIQTKLHDRYIMMFCLTRRFTDFPKQATSCTVLAPGDDLHIFWIDDNAGAHPGSITIAGWLHTKMFVLAGRNRLNVYSNELIYGACCLPANPINIINIGIILL